MGSTLGGLVQTFNEANRLAISEFDISDEEVQEYHERYNEAVGLFERTVAKRKTLWSPLEEVTIYKHIPLGLHTIFYGGETVETPLKTQLSKQFYVSSHDVSRTTHEMTIATKSTPAPGLRWNTPDRFFYANSTILATLVIKEHELLSIEALENMQNFLGILTEIAAAADAK